MSICKLNYGKSKIDLAYNEDRSLVFERSTTRSLSDIEFNTALDNSIGISLEDATTVGGSVLVVISANENSSAIGQALNLTVRRLIANGILPFDIAIIFSGINVYPLSESEKKSILTPFIHQRIKTIDHRPRDLMMLTKYGELDNGSSIDLNRSLTEYDHILTIGTVKFDDLLGFVGGPDLICPGLGSIKTYNETLSGHANIHRNKSMRGTLQKGLIDEIMDKTSSQINANFYIGLITNNAGETERVFSGDLRQAFAQACEVLSSDRKVNIKNAKRVIATAICRDIMSLVDELIATAEFCVDGGEIVLVLGDVGDADASFAKWISMPRAEIEASLLSSFTVAKYKAYQLKTLTERFKVSIVTDLEIKNETGLNKIRFEDVQLLAIESESIILIKPTEFLNGQKD